MISTHDHRALPDAAALQRLCKALAVLDAINAQEWELRYYSYISDWGQDEEVLEMRNGQGDHMLILFRPEGCVINGLLHEYEQPDRDQVTRGLPACFHEFIFGEPVGSLGTTFCLWYTPALGWQTGVLETEDDGSEELLYILDGDPETYREWANGYFVEDSDRQAIPLDPVARIYRGEPLTKEIARAMNDEPIDWQLLAEDVQSIGYPYDFSR